MKIATLILVLLLPAIATAQAQWGTPREIRLSLTWIDNSTDEAGFIIYRNGVEIARVGANVTTYLDTVPVVYPGQAFTYQVSAFNGGGESPKSNFDSAVVAQAGEIVVFGPTDYLYSVSRRITDTSSVVPIIINKSQAIRINGVAK